MTNSFAEVWTSSVVVDEEGEENDAVDDDDGILFCFVLVLGSFFDLKIYCDEQHFFFFFSLKQQQRSIEISFV